jgi:hypothetical protein
VTVTVRLLAPSAKLIEPEAAPETTAVPFTVIDAASTVATGVRVRDVTP